MGQWQCCSKTTAMSSNAPMDEKLDEENKGPEDHLPQEIVCGRPSGSDSAVDSGNGSDDEVSCNNTANGAKSGGNNNIELPEANRWGRNSHSSESSGKYSLRDSLGSTGGDYERSSSSFYPSRIDECAIDLPVFAEENEDLSETSSSVYSPGIDRGETMHSLHEHQYHGCFFPRKISRGSSSSERGSFSSVSSVTAILKARLGRSSSLVSQYDVPEEGIQSPTSPASVTGGEVKRPLRTVSLRLPKKFYGSQDSDTNLPTIYVDDSPQQLNGGRRSTRKSSLRKALSLLSLNSLVRHEASAKGGSSQQQQNQQKQQQQQLKSQKQPQRILRQPRRRHNTVRGMSGLAIDGTNQGMRNPSLHRAQTVYYPTATTSLRYAANARRTHSVTS